MARLSAAQKRLDKILADDEYGPALVRLNKRDERAVLDMIENGDRSWRRKVELEIDRLDKVRKGRRTVRSRAFRYAAFPLSVRKDLRTEMDEDAKFWIEYSKAPKG